MYVYIYIFIYLFMIVRPDSSVVKSVCTVGTRSWVRIPLGPTFRGIRADNTGNTGKPWNPTFTWIKKHFIYITYVCKKKS